MNALITWLDHGDHGPEEVYWDNLRKENVAACPCGFQARGDTWAEVGEAMDEHIEEMLDR